MRPMEVNIGLGQMVLAFVAAMGIPSAIMGLIIWRLERRIGIAMTDWYSVKRKRNCGRFVMLFTGKWEK